MIPRDGIDDRIDFSPLDPAGDPARLDAMVARALARAREMEGAPAPLLPAGGPAPSLAQAIERCFYPALIAASLCAVAVGIGAQRPLPAAQPAPGIALAAGSPSTPLAGIAARGGHDITPEEMVALLRMFPREAP